MNSYHRFCFRLLGERAKKRREEFLELRNNLLRARINTPFEAYLATLRKAGYSLKGVFGVEV